MSDTLTSPVLADTDTGDHDKFAHYVVPPEAITAAMISGTPVVAVCGKRWVPSRDPERFPVCPVCQQIYNNAPDE